ncbi:glycerol-3-phosphate acyltransferase [Theileria orientalis]|uniref:Glycerol-3-phosphate acyltransferase n=1 Tax=Theileria orientalis TaxID=68886 RepID=A0A976M9I6_THEOR|nr:glycerol-3-phosphate acyltransferase [Theileria orientalis]
MNISPYEFRAFNCYLCIKWLCKVVISSIFTNITIIHEERLPLYGPLIVVSNHNNQFVDAALLIYAIPRQMCFLVATKTLKRKLIGTLCTLAGCISVYRPDDFKYTGVGKIHWKKGTNLINGKDTKFTLDLNVGDKLQFELDKKSIVEIISDTQLKLESTLDVDCPDRNGIRFSVIPKMDQSETYEQVSASLKSGNSIVIFPEGGSHDRTNLLPLKPGVALMAFYSILDGAQDVVILPVGLVYNNVKKDQSDATIYYGNVITITKEDCDEFERDRRSVVTKLLGKIEVELNNCLITSPDIKIKEWIDLCASLYPPERSKIPVNIAFDLRKFISRIFWKYGDLPETKHLIDNLSIYKKTLQRGFLHDDEIWLLKQSMYSAFLSFLEDSICLICYSIIGLSFAPLWVPLYLLSNYLAERHRVKALKNSSVKLVGTDVFVSYKCLVLLVVVPILNLSLGLIIGVYFYGDLKRTFYSVFCCVTFLPLLYYVNLKYARKLPRLLRQLHVVPLIVMGRINIWREKERELITMRTELQILVRNFVHKMGPRVSDTFLSELSSVFPKVLIDSDTTRLNLIRQHYMPIFSTQPADIGEEVL